MKSALNAGRITVAGVILGFAIDGWLEAFLVVIGAVMLLVHFDYRPSVGEAAMRLLEQIYRKMYLLAFEIEREWRPMGGSESESKRLVLIAIRDQIPPHVQQLLEKGNK